MVLFGMNHCHLADYILSLIRYPQVLCSSHVMEMSCVLHLLKSNVLRMGFPLSINNISLLKVGGKIFLGMQKITVY